MNKTKILPALLKDGIFELSLKLLSDESIREALLFKDNDNYHTIKSRAILNILSSINLPDSTLADNSQFRNYFAEKSIYHNMFTLSETMISQNKAEQSKRIIKQFFESAELKEKSANDLTIKLNLDYLLYKSEFEIISVSSADTLKNFKKNDDSLPLKKIISDLENLEKKIVQSFANLNNYLKIAVKIDKLRTSVNLSIFRIKLKIAQSSKEKSNQLTLLYNEFKGYFQKKQVSVQSIIQKISELIVNQQSKVMLNTNKYKMTELSKSTQLFLKTISEIYKMTDKLEELYDSKIRDSRPLAELQKQIKDKIVFMDESIKAINLKAPPSVRSDIRELFSLYENIAYHKDKQVHLKKLNTKTIDNLNSFITKISKEEKIINSFSLYNSEFADYISIRNYLDNALNSQQKAFITLKASPSLPSAIYVLPDKTVFYGVLNIAVFKTDNKLRVDFIGYQEIGQNNFNKKSRATNSYFFEDTDDAVKFILEAINHYDLFNFLESERV